MNTVLKVGAAGALALAGVGAHASIASPSASSSDAILFAEVLNAAGTLAVASYAGDTGISINQLDAGGISTTVLGSDANLQTLFAADAAGDQLVWAVQGAQNTQSTTQTQFITTAQSLNKLLSQKNGILANWASGFTADVSTINSNIISGNSVEGSNPATAGVWDITEGTNNTSDWYGSQPTSFALGTTPTLYSEVTNGTAAATKGIETSLGTVALSSAGLTITESTGSPPPIPLPPAVWLLGSGLLGLAGVARRKMKA